MLLKNRDMAFLQQTQKQQTVLPMARRSSMDLYNGRQDDNANVTPDMEGWLYKQGCKYKKWNKRWFVLKGPNLFYFKSPKVTHIHLVLFKLLLTSLCRTYV